MTSPTEHQDTEDHHDGPIDQTDKPRAGIAAEYLAKGYKLSDGILQRAIELDSQRGISKKFIGYITNLDTTLGQKALGPEKTISGMVVEKVGQAHKQAKSIDEQRGISTKAGDVRCIFNCVMRAQMYSWTFLVLLPCPPISVRPEGTGVLHQHLEAGS